MEKKYPTPKPGQSAAEFVKEAASEMLQTKMVDMFSKPHPTMVQQEGENLYILDCIYDVWPEDEDRGKSAKTIAEIFQHKIREYSRIYDEYEYKKAEHKFENGGIMKVIMLFTKKSNY